MKLRYIVLSSLLVCGVSLSVDTNSSEAAKASNTYDSIGGISAFSESEYGILESEGDLKGGMHYKIYKDSNGYITAVYEEGSIDKVLTNGEPNSYGLPDANHHLFTGKILNESLDSLFSGVQTDKITMSETPNLENASVMFSGTSATEIDASKMTTDKVTDMSRMFEWSGVKKLNISNFNTSNVRNMQSMFSRTQIESLDLSHFDTGKVNNMNSMFSITMAKSLDLSSFNTSSVTDMGEMFLASEAVELDLSSFDTSSIRGMMNMFKSSKVETITFSSKFGPIGGKAREKTGLPAPSKTDGFTGDWVNKNNPSQVLSQKEFLAHLIPDGEIQTWTWEKEGKDDSSSFDSSAKTQGMLTFAQNKDVVDPSNPNVLDPTKPDIPLEKPENGSGGNGFKDFYINYVTDFNFNDIKITGGDMEHFADPVKMGSDTFAPFVQVTDNRGVVDGWKLEVVPSEFKSDKETLKGAELAITNGVIIGNNGQSADFKPEMGASLKLTPGNITSVMSAEKDKGYGTWTLNFTDQEDGSFSDQSGVKAVIPVSALPKVGAVYTADFTWTLSATPDV